MSPDFCCKNSQYYKKLAYLLDEVLENCEVDPPCRAYNSDKFFDFYRDDQGVFLRPVWCGYREVVNYAYEIEGECNLKRLADKDTCWMCYCRDQLSQKE